MLKDSRTSRGRLVRETANNRAINTDAAAVDQAIGLAGRRRQSGRLQQRTQPQRGAGQADLGDVVRDAATPTGDVFPCAQVLSAPSRSQRRSLRRRPSSGPGRRPSAAMRSAALTPARRWRQRSHQRSSGVAGGRRAAGAAAGGVEAVDGMARQSRGPKLRKP